MNIEKPKRDKTRVSIDYAHKWNSIDWNKVIGKVNKLQSSIAKAMKSKRINLVKKLQYLLTKSYYAKLLAVKKITTNKGKNTPGIDGVKWTSPASKYKGVMSLSNKRYKARPLKRVYIKKSSGKKKRPLGIPTYKDRAMQALYQLSLDPIAECILDNQSFGFRKHRSTKDACEYIFKCLSTRHSGKWVLEGDIKGCFDNISHKWIQDNIIMDKRILKEFLKSGYVIDKELYPTDKGTPQGGIISPTLANLVLNGMADLLKRIYWSSSTGNIDRQYNTEKVNITIYADDFIVTAATREVLEDVQVIIEGFLKDRGLELSKEKTKITHINKGFNFLGWKFKKHKTKLLIKPSKESVRRVKNKVRELIRKHLMSKQDLLIKKMNEVIRGWCNYHNHICAKETFQKLDRYVFYKLWSWALRRHSNKSKSWIKDRYFTIKETRDWIFKEERSELVFASSTRITRHRLIKFEVNPYLKEYKEYYAKRKAC